MKYPKSKLFEKLASVEHTRWAKWQKYLHSKCVEHSDGEGKFVCLSADLFRHWERQIKTDYKNLTEKEKDSDRKEVMKYWNLIK